MVGLAPLDPPYNPRHMACAGYIDNHGDPQMHALPLKAVLFWIAVALAPPDTSQIVVEGARRHLGLDETDLRLELFRRPLGLVRGRKDRDDVHQGREAGGRGPRAVR